MSITIFIKLVKCINGWQKMWDLKKSRTLDKSSFHFNSIIDLPSLFLLINAFWRIYNCS